MGHALASRVEFGAPQMSAQGANKQSLADSGNVHEQGQTTRSTFANSCKVSWACLMALTWTRFLLSSTASTSMPSLTRLLQTAMRSTPRLETFYSFLTFQRLQMHLQTGVQ